MNHLVSSCSTDLTSRGSLQVHVVSIINHFPITGATVRISHTNRPAQTIEEVSTNPVSYTHLDVYKRQRKISRLDFWQRKWTQMSF